MHIPIKPALALAIGIFILLALVAVQNPERLPRPLLDRDGGGDIKNKDLPLHGNSGNRGGLYGFQYHGF